MKHTSNLLRVVVVVIMNLLLPLVLLIPVEAQTWTPTGNMNFARASHQATLLLDGRVLVSGGQNASGIAIAPAEIFDPSADTWSLTGLNLHPRYDHTATLLEDGKVLVVGGVPSNICTSNNTAEIYDPSTGSWSSTGNLPAPVGTGHIAIRLLDGRVLVAGGGNRCGSVFGTAALYNPVTGTWSATGNMTITREFDSAALLSDGRVLVAGGVTTSSPSFLPFVASAEIYDPTTGAWTAVGSMATVRATSCNGYMQPYLAVLTNGDVLVAGGYSATAAPGCHNVSYPNAAEVFNSSSLSWTSTGTMSVPRVFTTLTTLNDGKVLVAGGFDGVSGLSSAELYDPTTGTWVSTSSMTSPREGHTATRLTDGRVLVAGGGLAASGRLATAEIYFTVQTEPICDIQMSQASYINGETVTAQVLRIANPTAAPLAIELKLWFDVPTMPPVSFVNIGANGDVVLPAGFDQNFGPLPLATVIEAFPRGTYGFNCRILHPVSGGLLVEDLNPFDIQ